MMNKLRICIYMQWRHGCIFDMTYTNQNWSQIIEWNYKFHNDFYLSFFLRKQSIVEDWGKIITLLPCPTELITHQYDYIVTHAFSCSVSHLTNRTCNLMMSYLHFTLLNAESTTYLALVESSSLSFMFSPKGDLTVMCRTGFIQEGT